MKPTVMSIVKIFCDADRDSYIPTWQWFLDRLELFKETTLRSLERQTDMDFIIMLVHGQRHKEKTKEWRWKDRRIMIVPVWDEGQALLQQIDADYLTITRIDSDDLLHEECIEEIHRVMPKTDTVEYLVWRGCYTWDRVNRYLAYHYRCAPVSTTQIFPKLLYKDWEFFKKTNCVEHSRLGGRLSQAIELSDKRVCNVRHGQNTNHLKNGQPALRLTEQEREELLAGDFSGIANADTDETIRFVKRNGHIITGDQQEIQKLLLPFGITP